jgi:tryptophan synthase beta subunit
MGERVKNMEFVRHRSLWDEGKAPGPFRSDSVSARPGLSLASASFINRIMRISRGEDTSYRDFLRVQNLSFRGHHAKNISSTGDALWNTCYGLGLVISKTSSQAHRLHERNSASNKFLARENYLGRASIDRQQQNPTPVSVSGPQR